MMEQPDDFLVPPHVLQEQHYSFLSNENWSGWVYGLRVMVWWKKWWKSWASNEITIAELQKDMPRRWLAVAFGSKAPFTTYQVDTYLGFLIPMI